MEKGKITSWRDGLKEVLLESLDLQVVLELYSPRILVTLRNGKVKTSKITIPSKKIPGSLLDKKLYITLTRDKSAIVVLVEDIVVEKGITAYPFTVASRHRRNIHAYLPRPIVQEILHKAGIRIDNGFGKYIVLLEDVKTVKTRSGRIVGIMLPIGDVVELQ